MSYGDDIATPPETMRGEDWPCLRQFCVFMENRVGRLHELLRQIEKNSLRVIAFSVLDSADFSTMRIVVDDTDRAREIFSLSNFTFFETDVIGVLLPDADEPMVSVCMALMQAELNIQYVYSLMYRRHGRNAIAVSVDDIDLAIQTLKEKKIDVLTEGDLRNDDEYFL